MILLQNTGSQASLHEDLPHQEHYNDPIGLEVTNLLAKAKNKESSNESGIGQIQKD